MHLPEKEELREVLREANQLEMEAAPPGPAIVPLAIPEIPIKRVVIFLILFYATIIAIRIFFIEGPSMLSALKEFAKNQQTAKPAASILYGYFLYMCLACQFFPIPTLPPIAFAAKIYSPLLIAFLGAIGTCIANLNDYAILAWLFRHHRVRKVRDIQAYRKLLHFFDRYAFLTLSAAAFLPIPIDVIRMLAISRAYSLPKYLAAAFTGRFPRYLLIAYIGKELPAKYILIIFFLSALPAVAKFVSDMIKKRRSNR